MRQQLILHPKSHRQLLWKAILEAGIKVVKHLYVAGPMLADSEISLNAGKKGPSPVAVGVLISDGNLWETVPIHLGAQEDGLEGLYSNKCGQAPDGVALVETKGFCRNPKAIDGSDAGFDPAGDAVGCVGKEVDEQCIPPCWRAFP